MTSRERVLLAIDHKPTDRAPADYEAHQEVTDRLMRKIGVTEMEELLNYLHVDMRGTGILHNQADNAVDAEGYTRTMWGARSRKNNPGDSRPDCILPFNEETTIDDVLQHPWPDANKIDYSKVKDECRKYYGTYAIYGSPWCPFFHEAGSLIGQENFFVWMHTKPDVVHAIIDKFVDYEVEVTRLFLQAADGMI